MAILLALFLKAFLVEAYKIPSGSMQPTLMGMPSPGDVLGRRPGEEPLEVKDRILVDKFSYKVRDPRRWEVVVFRYPLKRTQNFVKRLIGLPGERLRILYGDVWRWEETDGGGEWRILRRPDGVQSSHWRSLTSGEPEQSPWRQVSGAGWLLDGRDVTARGDGAIEYGSGGSIVDSYFDGYPPSIRKRLPEKHAGKERRHAVGDLRLTGALSASAATESVTVTFTEGQRRYAFTLPGPSADADASATIEIDPAPAAAADDRVAVDGPRLVAGRRTEFAVQNLDDRLTLLVDGDVVAELDVRAAVDQSSRVLVEVRGGETELEDLRLARDIYYFSDKQPEFELPADGYFVMGDNTLDSSDSREWSRIRFQVAGTDDDPEILVGNLRGGDNPSRPAVDPLYGRYRRFTDQWGVHHLIQSEPGPAAETPDWLTPVVELGSEPAPFIDRRLIVGRALAVFWPISPLEGIYRLRWVR